MYKYTARIILYTVQYAGLGMLCFYCCFVILHQLVLGGASLRQKEEVGEVGGREWESVFVCVSLCAG